MQAIRIFVHWLPAFSCLLSVAQPSAIAQCYARQRGLNAFANLSHDSEALTHLQTSSGYSCNHISAGPDSSEMTEELASTRALIYIISNFTQPHSLGHGSGGDGTSSVQLGKWTSLHVDARHLRRWNGFNISSFTCE